MTPETKAKKENAAAEYAKQKGIQGYTVKGNRMIYYRNYPVYLNTPKHTIKVTVRLDTMKEEMQVLKKWNPKGNMNMIQ